MIHLPPGIPRAKRLAVLRQLRAARSAPQKAPKKRDRGVETGRLVAALLSCGVDLARGREAVCPPPPCRGAPHKSVVHGFLHAYLVADKFLHLKVRGGNRRGGWKDLALDELSKERPVRERGRGSSRGLFKKSYERFCRAASQYAQDVRTFDRLVLDGQSIPDDLLRRLAEFDALVNAAYRPPRFIWGPKKPR